MKLERELIEVAPGVKVAPLPKEHIPTEIGIVRMQSVGNGTYHPVLVAHEIGIPLTDASELFRVPQCTLLRLCRGGFVKSLEPSPGFYQIYLASWFNHMATLRDDQDFWLNDANRRKYRDAALRK